METTLYELRFNDGRIFRVFCHGKNQKQRLLRVANSLKVEVLEILNGMHTIAEFEQIANNGL